MLNAIHQNAPTDEYGDLGIVHMVRVVGESRRLPDTGFWPCPGRRRCVCQGRRSYVPAVVSGSVAGDGGSEDPVFSTGLDEAHA